ncbi:hypothetical protein BGX27_002567 [Mortierella sp. AM989]|nr:hypothetical protein BGX27_002567 [Mortierella sp. AM989]
MSTSYRSPTSSSSSLTAYPMSVENLSTTSNAAPVFTSSRTQASIPSHFNTPLWGTSATNYDTQLPTERLDSVGMPMGAAIPENHLQSHPTMPANNFLLQDKREHRNFNTALIRYLNYVKTEKKAGNRKAINFEWLKGNRSRFHQIYNASLAERLASTASTDATALLMDGMKNMRQEARTLLGPSTASKTTSSSTDRTPVGTTSLNNHPRTGAESSSSSELNDQLADEDENEQTSELTAVAECTPFSHLVMRLYRFYGHSPRNFDKPIPFPTDTLGELYSFAEHILDNWHDSSKLERKSCLVALSGIINTMDLELEPYFTKYSEIVDGFLDKELFSVSEAQGVLINEIKMKLGNGSSEELRALRRYCSRRRDDLEESMLSNDNGQREVQEEELRIMQLMEFICEEIIVNQRITKPSEHEDVFYWRGIARILYEHDLVVRVGELGSHSTRKNRVEIESTFGGTESNVRGRKVDIIHQLCMKGANKPLELLAWEAKPSSALEEVLQTQLLKNIRINASIMNTLTPYLNCSLPKPSPMILDIVGSRALVYTVRKIEPSVFAAGVIGRKMIDIPMHADEIAEFLDGGSMSALLRIGLHNSKFAALVKQGYREALNQDIMAKITRKVNIRKDGPPTIFTPTKKQKTKQIQSRAIKPSVSNSEYEYDLEGTFSDVENEDYDSFCE